MSIAAAAFILSLSSPGPLSVPRHFPEGGGQSDSSRAVAFDRADRRAQSLIAVLSCSFALNQARQQGVFGPADPGASGACFTAGGSLVGVSYSTDSAFSRLLKVIAVDLTTRKPYQALDYNRILAEARARGDALNRGLPAFRQAGRVFGPIAIRFDGDSLEVWLMPVAVLAGGPGAATGGERGFVYSPDGRTLAREVNSFSEYRPAQVPDTGTVRIQSRERDVPLTSELVLARMLNANGRSVTIETSQFSFVLAGRGTAATWTRLPQPTQRRP